jgi:hypothetical protein
MMLRRRVGELMGVYCCGYHGVAHMVWLGVAVAGIRFVFLALRLRLGSLFLGLPLCVCLSGRDGHMVWYGVASRCALTEGWQELMIISFLHC